MYCHSYISELVGIIGNVKKFTPHHNLLLDLSNKSKSQHKTKARGQHTHLQIDNRL